MSGDEETGPAFPAERNLEELSTPIPVQLSDSGVNEVFSLVYEELRRLASFVRRNDPSATLNSTALLHEAWVKLKDSPNLAHLDPLHFKRIAAKAMRQVLVDAARKRNSQKRGGLDFVFVTLDDSAGRAFSTSTQVLALNSALDQLATLNPRQAEMVECRFFTGLSVAETAQAMQISPSMIERDWRAAKAWLAATMRRGGA
jgi:RNA polymerase sigma factor (TIGR02999 family)